MENFAKEFMAQLNGKVSDDELEMILRELEMFSVNYEIRKRETQLVKYTPQIPECYQVYLISSNKIGKGQNTISSLNAIKESGTYCGSNLWGDAVWTTNFAVIQVDGAGFIIGFNTSDSVHSGLNTIYYAIRSSGKEWVTKIDNL